MSVLNMMKIIKNSISKKYQNLIEKTLLENRNFPWYLLDDITYVNGGQKRPGLSHYFVLHQQVNSAFYEVIEPIIKKYVKSEVIRVRSFLQFPLNRKFATGDYDEPHIDYNYEHMVYLYYVKDSDGDTIFFDRKNRKKIIKKVTPKKGTLVIFNGLTYHTAQQPKNDSRCIININATKI